MAKYNHNVNNTNDFVEQVMSLVLEERECMNSYYISGLFTSVSDEAAIRIIKDRIEKDAELYKRTIMTVKNIIELITPTSCSKADSMSRLRVQPLTHQ